ncbi:hypothetical protein QBC33DRAFT_216653 [Phialemonium atrogriseum]|uniref:Secreted protein n=1 Tax=Phialemonium atrogriseum TaxID=1093897 RepID=A0AAJ0CAL6_9PEZI|nr:uncharacterized protein QBC33DRAFT_216653 [Phialemonium atrogriseum]KAK1770781.1 hypothetical protein QBC33DRAFT_216653 [Phialemonium atrogriseum]
MSPGLFWIGSSLCVPYLLAKRPLAPMLSTMWLRRGRSFGLNPSGFDHVFFFLSLVPSGDICSRGGWFISILKQLARLGLVVYGSDKCMVYIFSIFLAVEGLAGKRSEKGAGTASDTTSSCLVDHVGLGEKRKQCTLHRCQLVRLSRS